MYRQYYGTVIFAQDPENPCDSALRASFKSILRDGVMMDGFITVLDGYLMQITGPSQADCGNIDTYFSGHYCTYRLNVQAMCDAFLFFSFITPAKTSDSVAIKKTSLFPRLDSLPPGYCNRFQLRLSHITLLCTVTLYLELHLLFISTLHLH